MPVRGGADLRILAVTKALARFARVGVVALSPRPGRPPAHVDLWRAADSALPAAATSLRQIVACPEDPFAQIADPDRVRVVRAAVEDFAPTVVVSYRLRAWRVAAEALAGSSVPMVADLDEAIARAVRAAQIGVERDPGARVRVWATRAQETYERIVVDGASAVWVSSAADAAELGRFADPRRVRVVPNVVDVEDYAVTGVDRRARTVVFPAMFGYPPNEDAARVLLDDIAPRLPGWTVLLAGSFIPPWLRERAGPGVEVVGPVDRMADHLAASAAAVVPLRAGTGTRLKILECLATSTPVVSTPIGAEGLDLEPGRHFLAAQTPAQFVDAVRRLDDDPALVRRLTSAGLARVRARHGVDALVPVLVDAVAGVG